MYTHTWTHTHTHTNMELKSEIMLFLYLLVLHYLECSVISFSLLICLGDIKNASVLSPLICGNAKTPDFMAAWQSFHVVRPLIVLILQTAFWSHLAWPKGLMSQFGVSFTFGSERDCLLGATGILFSLNSPQRGCFTISPWAVLPSACFSPHPLIIPGISIMTLSQRNLHSLLLYNIYS